MIRTNRRDLLLGLAASGSGLSSNSANSIPRLPAQDPGGGAFPAPAFQRGFIVAHRRPGLTLGAGRSLAERRSNLVSLQTALDEAATQNKFFEIEPGVYEIYGDTGLSVPSDAPGFKWIGSIGANLVQFCANAPILTIGDTGRNGYAAHQTISGFSLQYGVDQSGHADAIALRLGASAWTLIEQFSACAGGGGNPGSIGLAVTSANTSNRFFFQNTIRNGEIGGGSTSLLAVKVDGTGNLWEDIYTHSGADARSRRACAGPAWDLSPPGQMDDNVFVRCNIEHVASQTILGAHGALNCVFVGLHIEDVELTGLDPALVWQVGGQIRFVESLVMDLALARGEGQAAIHRAAGYGERASFDGLHFKWSDYASGVLGADLRIVDGPAQNGNDTNPAVSIRDLTVEDDPGTNGARLTLNAHFDRPLMDGTFIAEAHGDNLVPWTRQLQMTISTAYTHYGMNEDSVLFVPAAIADFTITLSNRLKPSGAGARLMPRPGSRLRIRRKAGDPAHGTLTVIDSETSKVLTRNAQPAVDFLFSFEAKSWALAD